MISVAVFSLVQSADRHTVPLPTFTQRTACTFLPVYCIRHVPSAGWSAETSQSTAAPAYDPNREWCVSKAVGKRLVQRGHRCSPGRLAAIRLPTSSRNWAHRTGRDRLPDRFRKTAHDRARV